MNQETPQKPIREFRWGIDAAFLWTWLATVLFCGGLLFPFFTLKPGAGHWFADALLEFLSGQSFHQQTWSLLGGIFQLVSHGDLFIGGILLLLSVVFPFIKLTLLMAAIRVDPRRNPPSDDPRVWKRVLAGMIRWSGLGVLGRFINRVYNSPIGWPMRQIGRPFQWIWRLVRHGFPQKRIDWLEALGPWSMADVFVVSVLVATFKEYPGGTVIGVKPGYWLFLGSVFSAMVSVICAKAGWSALEDTRTQPRVYRINPLGFQLTRLTFFVGFGLLFSSQIVQKHEMIFYVPFLLAEEPLRVWIEPDFTSLSHALALLGFGLMLISGLTMPVLFFFVGQIRTLESSHQNINDQ